jgi:tetratricopeptide (TPR) repeat protein
VKKRWSSAAAVLALSALGLGMSATASAQAEECSGKKAAISKHLKDPMTAAFDAVKAQNWQEVINQVQIAQADTKPKSVFDEYWVHKLLASGYYGLKQYKEAAAELEAITDSPCMSEADRTENLKLITQVHYQLDNYPKVIEYGNRALKAGASPELAVYVGQAYYLTNDFKSAQTAMTEVVNKLEAEGKPPGEQNLRIIHGACAQLKDTECMSKQAEKLVRHYPKPEYWKELVGSLMTPDTTDTQMLHLLRLAMHVDAMTSSDHYSEMATLAMNAGLPGEAQTALDQGLSKQVFKDARAAEARRRLEEAKASATTDKASLAKQEASAKANAQGNADVKLGAAYLSYGEPAKAIEAITRGLGKGGVRNPDEAGILLGIAYLQTGNKPEAAKAFQSVSKDPTLARIAQLWMLNT